MIVLNDESQSFISPPNSLNNKKMRKNIPAFLERELASDDSTYLGRQILSSEESSVDQSSVFDHTIWEDPTPYNETLPGNAKTKYAMLYKLKNDNFLTTLNKVSSTATHSVFDCSTKLKNESCAKTLRNLVT